MQREDESLSTRDLAGDAARGTRRNRRRARDCRMRRRPSRMSASTAAPRTSMHRPQTAARPRRTGPPSPRSARARATPTARVGGADGIGETGSLLPEGEESDFQRRWEEIQTRFVDDPRQAVEDADALVAGVMQRIAEGFAQARDGLEGQWSRGEDVGTEELRVALQRYRAFFRRLLSA